jgi:hypothetical protein
MEGIKAEFELFRRMRPSGRTYAIRAPGGAASELPTTNALTLESQLRTSRSYPALLREIVADLAS